MATVQIFLNGEPRDVPADVKLDQILEFFSLPSQRIAIELNKSVVRRVDWPDTQINGNDKIEVVHFVGGG